MSDTREKIISCSLELFAVEGTKSVSIRDICAQVGIKESSVYYHFKNKQAIIDELYARFERRAEAANAAVLSRTAQPGLSYGENDVPCGQIKERPVGTHQ